MFVSMVVIQVAVLTCLAVITWKVIAISAIVSQNNDPEQTFCKDVSCQHGGLCSETRDSYRCNCTAGWEGKHCELDIDECLTSPCHDFAGCINEPGSYSCTCKHGYTGDGVSVCKVFLCQNQKDNWTLGMSVSDGNWSEFVNHCHQPDTFPFPTPICGNHSNQ
ncbi:protein crumbs homolog 1-like [Branchiostoma floridae x Branchiostoma japonicum]